MHHTTPSRLPHNALHSLSKWNSPLSHLVHFRAYALFPVGMKGSDVANWGEHSEPHTCGENGKLSVYLYIYIYIQYVRIPYIHPALFVRETRLAGQKG